MSNFKEIQSDLFATKQVVFVDHFFKNTGAISLGKNKELAFTLLLKCEEIGFSFDNNLLNVVSHGDEKEIEGFWNWVKKSQEKIYGPSKYETMYPNFPKQVVKASDLELLVNAFMHYSGDVFGIRILPDYKAKPRKSLKEDKTPLRMSAVTEDSLVDYFKNYLLSNTSLSESSKEMMKKMFSHLEQKDVSALEDLFVNNPIPQKENLAFMGAVVLSSKLDFNKVLSEQFKTPTDLLRLAVAINDGDTSLAQDTKFKSMSRPMRRALVAKLQLMFETGDVSQLKENMFTYKEQWTRLSHSLHVGEYKDKCPLAFDAVQNLRDNKRDESFNHKVEVLIEKGKTLEAAQMLKTRPGVFGRMINNLIVKADNVKNKQAVVDSFSECAHSVSTPVLLQIHAKFKYDNKNDVKVIMPKGGLGKLFVKSQSTDASSVVSDNLATSLVNLVEDTLVNRFKSGDALGNVYIEDALMLQNIPFAQRTASKALKTVPKGSRFVKETDKPIIRFFTWWKESGVDKEGKKINSGRVDIDLSVGIFDKDYSLIKQCAYYDMRSSDYLVHSGDITSAPKGAAEYIDVNLEGLMKHVPGAVYVGQLISSFTSQKYSEIPECYSGWMEREKSQRGEIFEPSTVQNKVDITAEATQVLTCLYDVQRKEYIWADMPIKANMYSRNLHSVRGALGYAIEGLVNLKKANLHDLFTMHANARGTIVDDIKKADTVFSIKEGITPFDSEVIAAQFLADEYVPKNKLKLSKP